MVNALATVVVSAASLVAKSAAIGIHAATLRRARNRAERALIAFARADRRGEVA